jgi:hypothetical protein
MIEPVIPGMIGVEMPTLVMRAWIAPMANALGMMLGRRRDEAARMMRRLRPVLLMKKSHSGAPARRRQSSRRSLQGRGRNFSCSFPCVSEIEAFPIFVTARDCRRFAHEATGGLFDGVRTINRRGWADACRLAPDPSVFAKEVVHHQSRSVASMIEAGQTESRFDRP